MVFFIFLFLQIFLFFFHRMYWFTNFYFVKSTLAEIRERDWCNVVTCHMDTAQAYVWRLQNFVLGEHILNPCPENPTPVKVRVSFYFSFSFIIFLCGRILDFHDVQNPFLSMEKMSFLLFFCFIWLAKILWFRKKHMYLDKSMWFVSISEHHQMGNENTIENWKVVANVSNSA